jgi:hypothetical protein
MNGRDGVSVRVRLAIAIGFVLIPILNFNFMLIFENLYLMIEKSKNSKWGLFGNLEKRFTQWSHNMLHVCRYFLMSLFKFLKCSKNAFKLNQSKIWSFRTPKIVILVLLIL